MTDALTTVRNIGPAMAEAFVAAGITSAEELRELGADTAYARLLTTGHRPHFIAYYALVMGLQGRAWNDCHGTEKTKLRERFDQLVAGVAQPQSRLIRDLDDLGVRIDTLPPSGT